MMNRSRCLLTLLGLLALLIESVLLIGEVHSQVAKGPARTRYVYIPSDQLQVLFKDASRGVLMPREQFIALWREARRRAELQAVEQMDAVLTGATYKARLDAHALRITGRIQIAKFRGGRQVLALPFGGLAIESARIGGQPARVGRLDEATVCLLLDKQGRFELKLEMSAPLARKEGNVATTLRLPPIPASELSIQLPRNKRLQVGETVLAAGNTTTDQQSYQLAIGPKGLVPLVISDRSAGGNRTSLVLASSHSVDYIEPAGLRWKVDLELQVYARATATFHLEVPQSVEVAEIKAPQLAHWTLDAQSDGSRVVTLDFRKPFLGSRSVQLLGFAALSRAAQWKVPTLKVRESAAHVGQVIVHSAPSLRVDVGSLVGIRPERLPPTEASNPAETGSRKMALKKMGPVRKPGGVKAVSGAPGASVVQSPAKQAGDSLSALRPPSRPLSPLLPLAFAFWDEGFQLPLHVTARRLTLQASFATLVEITRGGVALRCSATLVPRHAPIFTVKMQLPIGWDVTSVLAAGKSVSWDLLKRADGTIDTGRLPLQTVKLELREPLRPGHSLDLILTAERHPDKWLSHGQSYRELPLPEVRLVGADEVEGTILVQAPPDIELLIADLSEDLQPVAAEESTDGSTEVFGTALQYRYRDDARIQGMLKVRSRPAKVSAETLAFVRFDHGKLDVHYQLTLQIEQGKIREFGFALPAAVGRKIQIVPLGSEARVIEQRHMSGEGPATAGRQQEMWHIVLDRPVTGTLTLAVDFSQAFTGAAAERSDSGAPVPPPAAGHAMSVAVPVLALQGIARQSGIVALEAASDQQIDYKPENLRDLDPADVPAPRSYVPSQRIVAAYQYQRLPYRLMLSATRHAFAPVLNGLCESADIVSVAGRDGRVQHQARFWLRAANLQAVPVTLPEHADLWTVMLDGEPVEVRRQQQRTYLVPLPPGRADSTQRVRELALLYETRSSVTRGGGALAKRLWPWQLAQQAPTIAMTMLGTTWHVYPPDGTDLVAARGDFQPVTRLTRPTLASRLAVTIAEHSKIGWGWKLGSLLLVAMVVGLFALINTSMGCATNLTQVLFVVVVVGILISLLLPATQSAREAARRMQCSNNLKQIGLALHNYHDVYKQFPPATIGPYNVPRERQFSWIVAILPYMEQQNLYDALRLDLPWDHPQNAAVLQTALPDVFCPSSTAPSTTQDGFPRTCYVAVTGADATEGYGKLGGVIGLNSGLTLQDITDGTSNTLMVAEVTDGGPWFAGGAGTARRIDYWINNKTWSNHPGGGNVLLADGSVRFLNANTDPLVLRRMATARAGDPDFESEVGQTSLALLRKQPVSALNEPTSGKQQPASKEKSGKRTAETSDATTDLLVASADRVVSQSSTSGEDRANLSLRVAIEPHGEQAIRFHCDGGSGQLVLELQDTTFARNVRWFLVAMIVFGVWIGRRMSGPRKAILVIAGLAISIGLVGLIPLVWTPLLDGLLLGSLAAGLLWYVPYLFKVFEVRLSDATTTSDSNSGTKTASTTVAIVVAVGCSLFSSAGTAGPPPHPPTSKPASKPAGKLSGKSQPVAAPADAANPDSRSNLTLFVPYDPDSNQPLRGQQAFLPYDQYLRLWKKAHPVERDHVPPEARGLVAHAEYTGRLKDGVARFDGRLIVQHADDRWIRVPLPLGDVTLEKVEVNGQPAALADGRPAIYLQSPGLHLVDVRFSVPVERLGATGRLAVPLRSVASGRLLFVLPAAGLDVHVGGAPGGWRWLVGVADAEATASIPASTTPAAGLGRVVCVPLGAAGDLTVRWQPRRTAARTGQLFSVDQASLVELRDSGLSVRGTFHYQIQQGTLGELTLRVPADLTIKNVEGAEVADWSIAPDPDRPLPSSESHLLVISLKSELTTGTDVRIDGFRRLAPLATSIDVQLLEPLGVIRETGRVALGCAAQFEVRVEQTDQLSQINHLGLAFPISPDQRCTLFGAYRYNARPWQLRLRVTRRQPDVTVAVRTAVAVAARQVTLRSLLKINVAGAPVPSLRLRLPATLSVSQVRVPLGCEWFVEREDMAQYLKVELNSPVLGELELAVRGSLARAVGQADFRVPAVRLENVSTQQGQLAIYLDDDLQAVLLSNGGAQSIDPARLDGLLRPSGGQTTRYAFRYEAPPTDLRLRLSPAPSRVTSDVITVVSVREGGVAYVGNVDFEVRQAGCARFRISTPAWLGDDIEIRGLYVRQMRARLQDKQRIWEIELQQPVRGTYRLQLFQTLPLRDDGGVLAAVIRPLDVERSRSHLVLENLTPDEVTATTTRGVTAIPIRAVLGSLTDDVRRQAVAAYQVIADDATLAWQRRVREQESGLTASINLADLTTVVHADGHYQARAAYNIRNFTLQFLELELPLDSQVWSVHVSDQPVRPAKLDRDGHSLTLLPLQKTSAGDFSSKVVVIYSGYLGTPLSRWSRITPPAPRIVSDVPVSRTLWTLLVPSEYRVRLVDGESNVEEVEAAYQQQERKLSFLDELRQMVQVAGSTRKSAAGSKARKNLKQVGSALHSYARQSAEAGTRNAADVQQQAQQIEADIRRLEASKSDSRRTDANADFYFQPLPGPADSDRLDAELDRKFETLSEQEPPDATRPAAAAQRLQQQRGQLREQAAEQLERLQTMQRAAPGSRQTVKPSKRIAEPNSKADKRSAEQPRGAEVVDRLDDQAAIPIRGTAPEGTVGTGTLSLDLDLAMAGTAYHFRKLHGDPRMVISVRSESLSRLLVAVLWSMLCLVVAGVAIHGLRRPQAGAFASHAWPWFAALAGTAWLFLLPAGLFGAALLVTSLCVLIARSRRREAAKVSPVD